MTDPAPGAQRGSGDAAVEAALRRSAGTAALNLEDVPTLPIEGDTANLRLGAELNPACHVLLPLVGVWRGEGEWNYPTLDVPRRYGQQITISHDGREFLRHEAITWLLPVPAPVADGDDETAAGDVAAAESAEKPEPADRPEPAAREVGWWRPQPDGTIELVIAHSEGVVELFYGTSRTLTSWTFGSDAVIRTASAPEVTGASRLYGIVDGKLAYVEERATAEHELQPHTSALLERIIG
ncbi:FABP family protein [Nakamurella flavida]|uniref:Peroxynitrite isomerase n=1 Tax=Nakamurella flavida TaxID=363630 RepID=A0A939C656_9ACTN|nr:FABP family protein [Nakamurella flavida]MBM9477659.1 FABP family protein [Nakamurella flavida]MDP9779209.1 hypothetical protein [Nakamurella flavida]